MNAIDKSPPSTASTDAPSPEQLLAAMTLPGADLAALAQQFKLALAGKSSAEQTTNAPSLFTARDSFTPGEHRTEPIVSPLVTASRDEASSASALASNPTIAASRSHEIAAPSETSAFAIPTHADANVSLENDTRGARRRATAESDSDTLGAAVLQSLLSLSSAATLPSVVASTSSISSPTRVQSLESVVAETVSRVLVSDPLHDGRREVRIEFAKEVLPDTEVRLWRHEGRLHVEFISSPSVADNGLSEALPRLGDAIQQRQHENFAPVVTLRTHGGGDHSGHPGDGRSRQQYRTPEEIEENA